MRDEDSDYAAAIKAAYNEVVLYRKNLFKLPTGAAAKAFVTEKARLFSELAQRGQQERIAMEMAMVMEPLLLQRSLNKKANAKDNRETLTRRMLMWENRQVGELLEEARAIQQRLPTERREMNADEVTRIFTKLMFEGGVSSALNFLNRKDHGGIQALTPEVRAKLEALHPEPDEGPADVYLQGDPPEVQPIICEEITAGSIKQAANRTRGGAGPSGGDAEHWKRMLYSFGDKSEELAGAMAGAARRMCAQTTWTRIPLWRSLRTD